MCWARQDVWPRTLNAPHLQDLQTMVAPPPRRQGIFRSLLSTLGFERKDCEPGSLADPADWLQALFSGEFDPSIAGIRSRP